MASRCPHAEPTEVLTLTLVGFGSVNRALARLVHASEESLSRPPFNLKVRYHAIIARHGSWEALTTSALRPATVARIADEIEAGVAKLDGSTPVAHNCRARPKPSIEEVRGIISRTPAGVSVHQMYVVQAEAFKLIMPFCMREAELLG